MTFKLSLYSASILYSGHWEGVFDRMPRSGELAECYRHLLEYTQRYLSEGRTFWITACPGLCKTSGEADELRDRIQQAFSHKQDAKVEDRIRIVMAGNGSLVFNRNLRVNGVTEAELDEILATKDVIG